MIAIVNQNYSNPISHALGHSSGENRSLCGILIWADKGEWITTGTYLPTCKNCLKVINTAKRKEHSELLSKWRENMKKEVEEDKDYLEYLEKESEEIDIILGQL